MTMQIYAGPEREPAPAAAPAASLAAAPAMTMRRLRDIVGCLLILALTLPLLLLVALAIKATSRGPVLYRQDRVGLHGRVFSILKFRSMRLDAEAAGPRWADRRDPRVTPIGRLLRGFHIDEIPQIFNVLRGEMSLVGPRPERPVFVDELSRLLPRYTERSTVLPGITGCAQVRHPYGASVEDARAKLVHDLHYVANPSLGHDLRILAATVHVVLFRVGAR